MILTIARKEILEMSRDGRFRAAALIIFTLLVVSLAVGWKQYRDVAKQHEQARATARQHWVTQGTKGPHSAAHYGVYAFKPKSPLSLVDQGADPYTGVAVWLEAHKQNEFKYRPAQDKNTLARFGELTAAVVLQILLPLLIVLLTFSAFAGEREQGTLRQLLSLGVARRDLAAGKALGIAFALAALLVPAALIGSVVLTLGTEAASLAEVAPRAVLLALFHLLYFGAFLGIALAVSARMRSPRMALIVLLAFWIFNCLIAPRAVADIARQAHPTPSSVEFAAAMEADLQNGIDGHSPSDKRAADLKKAVLTQYKAKSVEELPVSFIGIVLAKGEEYGGLVFDKHYNALWDQFERQNRFRQATAVAAPLLAVQSLSMSMAGTDFGQFRHFATAAEQYRRSFIRAINDDITRHGGNDRTRPYLRGDDLWSQIPEFQYTGPSLAHILQTQLPAIVLLAAWFAAAGALAYFATTRMEAE